MPDQPLSQRLREIRETHTEPAAELERGPEVPRRVLLGQLLVEKGLISEHDLAIALAQQREDSRPLGQILIGMGILNEPELARTLTEQHGFDFTNSLRRRLSPVAQTDVEDVAAGDESSEPEIERYFVREPGLDEPVHVAGSFLDAADAAFELIEDRDPFALEIVRARAGAFEHIWSYNRADSQLAS